MAITLHMEHTFSTRVVATSEQLLELRESLQLVLAGFQVAQRGAAFAKESPKVRAQAFAEVENIKRYLAMEDEQMLASVMKAGVKTLFKELLADSLKDKLFAASVSPIKTAWVAR
ncbi:hypothetical protein [Pseudomonas sp. zfem003]|uniref:hypothetical protein n=1 Tax=Pseudomonas sp. zfem003 TaxID=3078198 RepID=UPI002928F31B|nr:hypothetical protein [Pseudomonas sp. zfem003]MDU9399294.1 hypothetical protein [Pseudomonas sp. zfem003]